MYVLQQLGQRYILCLIYLQWVSRGSEKVTQLSLILFLVVLGVSLRDPSAVIRLSGTGDRRKHRAAVKSVSRWWLIEYDNNKFKMFLFTSIVVCFCWKLTVHTFAAFLNLLTLFFLDWTLFVFWSFVWSYACVLEFLCFNNGFFINW